MSLRPTDAGRTAALVRLACSPILWGPSAALALGFVGQGVFLGLLIAIAPTYLMWVWLVDLVAIVRGLWRPIVYSARPRYWLFGLASFLSLPIYWLSMLGDPTWRFPEW
ncbi:MAG: hypothetical protein JWN04_3280 [Myxococcaceae bacterium]|nr:hypothetical protein [Myxococcaceae bacterium]